MKRQQIDLIPAELHDRRARGRRLRVWATLLGLVLAGQVVDGVHLHHRARQVKACVAQASELRRVMQVVRDNNDTLSTRIRHAEHQIARLDLLAGKHRWSQLLDWLASRCPPAVVLTQLHVEAGAGQPGAHRPGRRQSRQVDSFEDLPMPRNLVLSGYAADHPGLLKFIALLKDSDAFAGVSLLQTKRETLGGGEAVVFTLLCQW